MTRTQFRLKLDGGGFWSPTSAVSEVASQVQSLTNPAAPKTARKNKQFTVSGYLAPAHPSGSSSSVRILIYRKSGSSWKSSGYSKAKNANSGGITKYSASLKLGKGTYRIKFTDEGHVTVEFSCTEAWMHVVVEDSGIGISEQDTARVTEEYFRTEAAGQREGTGIGPAVTRELAEALGGSLSLSSTLGEGSRFDVALPRRIE
jgi:hypothetical protein